MSTPPRPDPPESRLAALIAEMTDELNASRYSWRLKPITTETLLRWRDTLAALSAPSDSGEPRASAVTAETLSQPGDNFHVLGSGFEAGFDAGYPKGYADGLEESAGDPRVERIEAGFKAMHAATNGEYSHEDMAVMDALQAGRDFAVRLARREQHIQQLIRERPEAVVQLERLVLDLQAHAKEAGWQDVDEPIAALLEWRPQSATQALAAAGELPASLGKELADGD